MKAAVFLDRDGVLVEDSGCLVDAAAFRILPGVPAALCRLQDAGYLLVVVTNQAVVARGLASETQVEHLNARLQELLCDAGGPVLDGWYICPHHPNATLPQYRLICTCRKPAPGLLIRAATELGIDLALSSLVGDRITDIQAGVSAGCSTAWVQTGRHDEPAIETATSFGADVRADHVCADLPAAAEWILNGR